MEQKTFQNIMDVFSRIIKDNKNYKTFCSNNIKPKKKKTIMGRTITRKTGTHVRSYQPKFIFRNYPREKQNLLKHHGHHTPLNKLGQFPCDFPKIPSIIFSKHKMWADVKPIIINKIFIFQSFLCSINLRNCNNVVCIFV